MKVLSVRQPHATLLALGLKLNETRSRRTKHRGETGIHASKGIDKESCRRELIKSVLAAYGYDETNLPTGCIIAIGNLKDCLEVVKSGSRSSILAQRAALLSNGQTVEGNEYEFGWYEEGRFAWEMADMKQIEPIPAKGQLGLWNYDLEEIKGRFP